jgi:predicted nucleic acid-binding protein
MIVYFDTSAFVPLLINEPSSPRCLTLWQQADTACSSAIIRLEASAALAQARRNSRIKNTELVDALDSMDELLSDMNLIQVDTGVIREGAAFARSCALRAYDALHCATAFSAADEDFVAASGDAALLRSWQQIGLTTANTAPTPSNA